MRTMMGNPENMDGISTETPLQVPLQRPTTTLHRKTSSRSYNFTHADVAAALSHLPTAVIVVDIHQTVVYANSAAQRLKDSSPTSPDFGNDDYAFDRTPSDSSWILGRHLSTLKFAVTKGDRNRLQQLCGASCQAMQRAEHRYLKTLTDKTYRICDVTSDPNSPFFCSAPLDIQVWTSVDNHRYVTLSFDLPFVPKNPLQALPTPDSTPDHDLQDWVDGASLTTGSSISRPSSSLGSPWPMTDGYQEYDEFDRDFVRYAHFLYNNAGVQKRSAFFFSGDERTCVTCYRGGLKQTHQVDDLESFINTQWVLYDEKFNGLVPFEDSPFVTLSRHKEEYKKHFGWISPEGERILLEIEGKLIHSACGEYIGCSHWIFNMGAWEDYNSDDRPADMHSYERILELLPHYTWTLTPSWAIDWFSKSWSDYVGIQPLIQGWKCAIHPDDLPGLMEEAERCKAAKSGLKSFARYRRHDGVYRWCAVFATPLLNGKGQIIKWYGSTTDIHEQHMHRLEHLSWKDRVLSTLSSVPLNIFATDADAKLVLLEGGLGVPPWTQGTAREGSKNPLGVELRYGGCMLNWLSGYHGRDGLPGLIHDCLSQKKEQGEIEEFICNRWIKTFVKAHTTIGRDGQTVVEQVVGCTFDITEAKSLQKLERENAKILVEKKSAMESNRLKTQFLAHMSHELRTPIAGIMGMSSLLRETNQLNEEELDYVDSIKSSAERLLTIVNDLLDHSKIEAGRFEVERVPFDLQEVFKSIVHSFKYGIQQKGLQFHHVLEAPPYSMLLGDSLRLTQVLTNLISNATKFTDSPGSITFTTTFCAVDDKEVIQFVVQDTGIGMTPEVLSTLFVPFKQGDSSTSRIYGGTGLGLIISKSLAELMGGTLELLSAPEKGTRAVVTIPAFPATIAPDLLPALTASRSISPGNDNLNKQYARESVGARQAGTMPSSRHASPAPRKPIRILIAEDNAINAKIAIKTVRKLGYETVHVWNGQQALDHLIDDTNPAIDLVLMDCQMPVLDGYAATHALRNEKLYTSKARLHGLPVVALTASAIKGDKEKALAAGMDAYMMKPFTKDRLDEVLNVWLSRRLEGKDRPRMPDARHTVM